jgi:hypothetical protein
MYSSSILLSRLICNLLGVFVSERKVKVGICCDDSRAVNLVSL